MLGEEVIVVSVRSLLLVAAVLVGLVAWPLQVDAAPGSRTGAVRPVPGPVLAPFAPSLSGFGPGTYAVALAAPEGAPVRAALPGRVAWVGEVAGTGPWVTLDHGADLLTTYGPLDPAQVSPGASVIAGRVLGQVADGEDRIRWSARVGPPGERTYIDPLTLLGAWEVHLVPVVQ